MPESPKPDDVVKALKSLSRNAGGIEVSQLTVDPTLLVLFGGPQMGQESGARRRLASKVREVLLDAIADLRPTLDQLTGKAMLGATPGLWDMNITERVHAFFGDKGGLTMDIYNHRRPGVLRRLAEALIVGLQGFDPAIEPTPEPPAVTTYDLETRAVLRQLVWHAQDVACYLLAYRTLVVRAELLREQGMSFEFVEDSIAVRLVEAPEGKHPQFESLQRRHREPGVAASLSLYEYLAIGTLIWDLQQLPDGRRFLREHGLEHLSHASLETDYCVPWGAMRPTAVELPTGELKVHSASGMEVQGPFRSRSEYSRRLHEDEELQSALSSWHQNVTAFLGGTLIDGQLHTEYFPISGPLRTLMEATRDLLDSLASAVLADFATVEAMQHRRDQLDNLITRQGNDDETLLGGAFAVPQRLAGWLDEGLWGAVTSRRQLDRQWDERDDLPPQPGRVIRSTSPEIEGAAK